MEPDRFYRQHVALDEPEVDADSFRPFWRIRTRLDQLLIDRAITPRQWQAAQQFRSLADSLIRASWQTIEYDRRGRTHYSFDDATLRVVERVEAGARLNKIRVSLGSTVFQLLELHLVHNESWRDIANRYDVHPRTARRWVIAALQALALVR